jgi:hypothetical protein
LLDTPIFPALRSLQRRNSCSIRRRRAFDEDVMNGHPLPADPMSEALERVRLRADLVCLMGSGRGGRRARPVDFARWRNNPGGSF